MGWRCLHRLRCSCVDFWGLIMTTCTFTADCGILGEVDLTISYKFRKGHRGTRIDPSEPDSATIYSIKIGGEKGIEVDLPDNFIADEIIPFCVEDYAGETAAAAEANADMLRDERRAA